MDIKYTGFKCVDWVDLAQHRGKAASFREYGNESYVSIQREELLEYMRNC